MSKLVIKIPTEKQLELFIEEEEKIRMSKEYQEKCTEVKNIPNGWLKVTADVQKNIVMKYGFTEEINCDIALNYLRRARYIYPDNQKFKSPVYVRENKANMGTFKKGDNFVDIDMYDINKKNIKLSELIKNDTYNLILASSHT